MKHILNKIMIVSGLGILMLNFFLLQNHYKLNFSETAFAVAANSAIATACTDPTATGFVPGVTITTTWSAPAAGSAATPSGTAALSNAVNGDSNPAVTSTFIDYNEGGSDDGAVLSRIQSPNMKVAGLQCQLFLGATLEAHDSDLNDDGSYIVVMQPLSGSDTTLDESKAIDNKASNAKALIFGTSAFVGDEPEDGSDADSANNGEFAFGGSNAAAGGSEMLFEVNVTNYSPLAANDEETFVFTFTPVN